MNEFIKKLIERLEETDLNDIQMVVREVLLKYGFPYESVVQDEVWDALDELSTNKFAIGIINQLAEEYNNESVNGDLISRKVAKTKMAEWLRNWLGEKDKRSLEQALDELPTAYNDGWIIANCTDIEEGRAEYYKKLKCIAWQPLPAPYQPKGE